MLGRTPREVRELLGAPYPDELSDGGGSLHYRVGANNSDDVSLYVEFRGGRAVYVSAPARERNARQRHQRRNAYSTVTVFARLRGWSTFSPRLRAT